MSFRKPTHIYDAVALTVIGLMVLASLTGCGGGKTSAKQKAIESAWAGLEPYTNSHERSNWEAVGVNRVTGEEVVEKFSGAPMPCLTSRPPANAPITPGRKYWLVQFEPKPATPLPTQPGDSPTAPARVPEPFSFKALILVDASSGKVVARQIFCVIP